MLSDFNKVTNSNAEFHTDFCIVGSGPAGITLAISLAKSGHSVSLVEGGSFDLSDESQNIYKGTNLGLPYSELEDLRLRYFGGTSNHWAGMCGVLESIDFEERGIFGLPGWPISRDEILFHLPAARTILDLDDTDLSEVKNSKWKGILWRQRPFVYSPPTRFGEKYRAEIVEHPQIHLLLNASLINIQLEQGLDSIESLTIKNYVGSTARLMANKYVFAMGSLENARILLNADTQMEHGIGNSHGLVGRCFMEHLQVDLARFVSTNDDFWFPNSKPASLQLLPDQQLLEDEQIGNGVLAFDPSSKPVSYGRTRIAKQIVREIACSTEWTRDTGRYFVDFDCAGNGVVSSLIEQLPNLDSRLQLSDTRDQLGLRRIALNWSVTDRDRHTIRRLAIKAATEMAEKNIARLQLMPYITNEKLEIPIGGHAHQMGTTRMSHSPAHGVVDTDCRVHGLDNLYIAGSSVFPTGGGTNPTLTIVMLALRLALHLSKSNQ